jgi:hypothetical protein
MVHMQLVASIAYHYCAMQSVSLRIKGPQPIRLVYSVFCRDSDPAWPFSADCCDWAEEHSTVTPPPWLQRISKTVQAQDKFQPDLATAQHA